VTATPAVVARWRGWPIQSWDCSWPPGQELPGGGQAWRHACEWHIYGHSFIFVLRDAAHGIVNASLRDFADTVDLYTVSGVGASVALDSLARYVLLKGRGSPVVMGGAADGDEYTLHKAGDGLRRYAPWCCEHGALMGRLDGEDPVDVAIPRDLYTPSSARALWVPSPNSERIATALILGQQHLCPHGRDPCYLRCGVRKALSSTGTWEVIPEPERRAWQQSLWASPEPDASLTPAVHRG